MEKIDIYVNNKKYLVDVADTDELREQGLKDKYFLPQDRGMLFVFEEPCEACMWMKDTRINLDMIFIDEQGCVISCKEGEYESEEFITEDNVKYVLELNKNSGVKEGDHVDLSELKELYDESDEDFDTNTFKIEIEIELPELKEKEESSSPLLVIDEKGRVQMQLKGGERIFSRKNTKTLISMAKRAWLSKEEKDYKALGRKVFQYLDYQNNKKDDYVEIKT